jgi:hypothetical protein
MVLGGEAFRLVRQNLSFGQARGSLALDRDGSLRFERGSQNVDPWRIAHRDRGDEAPAGELSRDEVFTGYASKLEAGFHVYLSLLRVA